MSKRLMPVFVVLLVISAFSVSGLRINEVEMNPTEGSSGSEWVELYNDREEDVDISGFIINDSLKERYTIANETTIAAKGYYIIEFSSTVLNNDGDLVILSNFSGEIIDETGTLEETKNSSKTYQFCNSNWSFIEQTKGTENNCTITEEDNETEEGDEEEETENTPETTNTETEIVPLETPVSNHEKKYLTMETIKLSAPKDIKSKNESVFDKGKWAVYGFAAFSAFLAGLFFLKKRN